MTSTGQTSASAGRYDGTFGRLTELTDLMTRATDELRALPPKDRENRNRISETHTRVSRGRLEEVTRLHQAGHPLDNISARLDRTDPYRHGVPDNRPVRHPQPRSRAGR